MTGAKFELYIGIFLFYVIHIYYILRMAVKQVQISVFAYKKYEKDIWFVQVCSMVLVVIRKDLYSRKYHGKMKQ